MVAQRLKPFAQPRHNTAVEVNKESIARNFGVDYNAVAYATKGLVLDGVQILYDEKLQRTYPLPAGVVGGSVVTSYAAGQLTYQSGNTINKVDLNALCVQRAQWFILYGYDFNSGATMRYANDVLEYYDPDVGAFTYYRWAGKFPKIVPYGTSPVTDNADKDNWVIVGTQAISSALSGAQGASQVGWGTTNVAAAMSNHAERLKALEVYPERVGDLETWATASGQRLVSLEDVIKAMQAVDGEKNIGWLATIADLRKTEPTMDGQRIRVREYEAGGQCGGGYFIYDSNSQTQADDGGFFIVTAKGKRWRRDKLMSELTIVDFGAREGGVFNCTPAAQRMYNFMIAQSDLNNMGVRLPMGNFAFAGNLDTGSKEIGIFNLHGAPVHYGVVPATTITLINDGSTTPLITTNSRRMSMSGIRIRSTNSNPKPFYKNVCAGGQYINVYALVWNGGAGRLFDIIDTIDCRFDQVYAYRCVESFIYCLWSNRYDGSWDHSTAMQISNANFTGMTKKHVIFSPRNEQCLMSNVWFQTCEYPGDISQGGWSLYDVSIEGCTHPIYTKYAKLKVYSLNVQNGPGLDDTMSDYDPLWDKDGLTGGNMPSWVASAYERGFLRVESYAQYRIGGTAEHYKYSRMRLENLTGKATWFNVGTISMQNLANSFKLRILGVAGWNGAGQSTPYRPDTSNLGGGEAIIRGQVKAQSQTTGLGEITWHGEGACPIQAVKYVHSWNNITVYVKMAAYARYGACFFEQDGTSRIEAGMPFFITPSLASISDADMAKVANVKDATSFWSINKGPDQNSGLAFNLDNGELLMFGTESRDYLTVWVNGLKRYIRLTPRDYAQTFPAFTRANRPNVNDGVFTIIMITDAPMSPALQPAYSNGYSWFYMTNNQPVT